jgi:hypothetical protein
LLVEVPVVLELLPVLLVLPVEDVDVGLVADCPSIGAAINEAIPCMFIFHSLTYA